MVSNIGKTVNEMHLRTSRWLAAIIILAAAIPVFPQDDAAVFSIRFAGGANHFRVGEIISIELNFSAAQPDTYYLDARDYDRSGRMNLEQFHLTPPARDPLRTYYGLGFIGGGMGNSDLLTGEPHTIREDLNEWVAVEAPGHYSLYVTTSRVSRRGEARNETLQLRSNSLDFDVTGVDTQWQEEALAAAVSVLQSESSSFEARKAALRTLRFLDSPHSIAELVRQMGSLPEGRDFDAIAGLAGSRNHALVVRELEQQMAAPGIALTAVYLHTLAHLKIEHEHPLKPYPEHDQALQKIWVENLREREKELLQLEDSLFEQAVALVPLKLGQARTETVRSLLARPGRGFLDVRPVAGLPESEVIAAFLAVPPDEQFTLLNTFWDRLRIPAMANPLETILAQPTISHPHLRNIALRRLYELDPARAADFMLEEIRQPHLDQNSFTVAARTLGLLPSPQLPEFDGILASRLEQKDSHTFSLDAQLVARFSSIAILPRVKAAYRSSTFPECAARDGFILYFLRTDPDYGIEQIAANAGACLAESFLQVKRMKRWGEVEPAIIAELNNPDESRAQQAAQTLARYGGARAEKALWARLGAFHRQWAGREKDLLYRPDMKKEMSAAMSFQQALIESLGHAQAWLLDDEQVNELESLALGTQRENVHQYRWKSPVVIDLNILPDDQLFANINGQQIRDDVALVCSKMAQFPRGTSFRLITFGNQERLASLLRAIDDQAIERGLVIESER